MERLEEIAIVDNQVEAGLLGAILNERQIPHLIVSHYDTAYDGIFQPAQGWGHIEAPANHREEILAVLEDLRAGPTNQER